MSKENSEKTHVYKKEEFDAFIKIVAEGVPIDSWQSLAADLGVSNDTISLWKHTAEYKKARTAVIAYAIKGMKRSGVEDWRMYDRLLRLYKVDTAENIDITSGGRPITQLLEEIDGSTRGLQRSQE